MSIFEWPLKTGLTVNHMSKIIGAVESEDESNLKLVFLGFEIVYHTVAVDFTGKGTLISGLGFCMNVTYV